MSRIPFTVIGGFLGAGKTTLLMHWLAGSHGQRIAVLVNDFGAINIDAALIARRGHDSIRLSNGCVCCSIGGDLSAALMQLLRVPDPAAGARRDAGWDVRWDAIVVEASGVGDPWRIAQYAIADPQLQLDGVIVVVDAQAVLLQAADPLLADSVQRPLKRADVVLLNKADLVGAGQLAQVRAWVAQHAGLVPLIETVQAQVPLAVITGAGLHRARGGVHAADHGERFETWSAQPAGRYDDTAVAAWLRQLPAGVLRLKGFLQGSDGGWFEIQFAGSRSAVLRIESAPEDGAALVVIGLKGALAAAVLQAGLDSCAARTGAA